MTTYIIFQKCFEIFNIQNVSNYEYNACKLTPIKEQISPVYGTLWMMIAPCFSDWYGLDDIQWTIFYIGWMDFNVE